MSWRLEPCQARPALLMEFRERPELLPEGGVWEELNVRPDWLVWRAGQRQDSPKLGKLPVNAEGVTVDREAAAELTFSQAVDRAERLSKEGGSAFGVGLYCRPDTPVRVADIDNLSDPAKGELVDRLVGLDETYVEKSPSGNGARVLMAVPDEDGDKGWASDGVEFSGASGKFFTFTGARISKTRAIAPAVKTFELIRSHRASRRAGQNTTPIIQRESTRGRSRPLDEMLAEHDAVMANARYRAAFEGTNKQSSLNGAIDRSAALASHAFHAKGLGWTFDEWWDVCEHHRSLGWSHALEQDDTQRAMSRAWTLSGPPTALTRDGLIERARSYRAAGRSPGAEMDCNHRDRGRLRPQSEARRNTWGAAVAREVPPTNWRIQNLVGPGMTLLSAASKAGKSTLATQIAASIGSGSPLFHLPTKRGGVLVFAPENGRDITDRRIQKMEPALELDEEPLVEFRFEGEDYERPTCLEEGIALVLSEMEALREEGFEVSTVILDTLRFMTGTPPEMQRGANAQDKDFAMIGPWQQFAKEAGVAIVALAHSNKPVDGRGGIREQSISTSGSQLITGTVETFLSLVREVDRETKAPLDNAVIQRSGREITDETTLEIHLDREGLIFELMNEGLARRLRFARGLRKGTVQLAIYQELRATDDERLPRAELRDRVSVRKPTAPKSGAFRKALRDLEARGVVQSDDEDVWIVPDFFERFGTKPSRLGRSKLAKG